MIEFFQSGGVSMWFILAFGLAALGGAVYFAVRPDELRLGALRAISWATVFASLSGFIGAIATTLRFCARLPEAESAGWHVYFMQGFAESSANLILGLSLLALAWLVIAVGLRRLAAREARGA